MSAGTFLGLCRRQHLCRFSHLADGVHSCQVPFKASTVDADAKLKYRLVWSCMMCIISLKHIHIMYNRKYIYIYQYILYINIIYYLCSLCVFQTYFYLSIRTKALDDVIHSDDHLGRLRCNGRRLDRIGVQFLGRPQLEIGIYSDYPNGIL